MFFFLSFSLQSYKNFLIPLHLYPIFSKKGYSDTEIQNTVFSTAVKKVGTKFLLYNI